MRRVSHASSSPVIFRDVHRPDVKVHYPGASEYAEALEKSQAGFEWVDSNSGEFMRSRPRRSTPTRRPAARDYLADAL